MAFRLRSFRGIATCIALLLAVFWAPLWVYDLAGSVVRLAGGFLVTNVRQQGFPVNPIKASIRNVTMDFDELSNLITEFLQGPAVDPAVQLSFQDFLAHPHLEFSLDWLLTTYKFVFPFLIISMVAKLAGGGERDRAGIEEQRSDDLDSLISIRTSAKPGSPLGPSTPLSQQTTMAGAAEVGPGKHPDMASPRLAGAQCCRVRPSAALPAPFSSLVAGPSRSRACGAVLGRSLHQGVGVRAAATPSAVEPAEETFSYQTETDRIMDMIVNSLYSNRDVFVRELVSNASDALDKMRLTALQNQDEYKSGADLEIRIKVDKEAGTLTIEDSGIGMTREELLSSLGTIARSGTKKFMEAMQDKQDANLIGQFGVGFYSAFLVADKVTVQTKSNASEDQWTWEGAAGAHSYKVRRDAEVDLKRGTRITLHLKEDAKEFADAAKIEGLLKQYSEFISFPIKLWTTSFVNEQVQNDSKPLWTRSAKEVTREEQNAFFKTTFKEFLDPAAVSQFNVEGTLEFSGLLYIPGMAPFDQQNMMGKPRNIRLYVKRVFISDEFDEDLLPRWAGFVKGVVDSSDLPLNISREILQENRIVRAIRKQLVKRTLDMLNGLAEKEDKEEYGKVWESFGKYLKVGILDDASNQDALAKLLRFKSSNSEEGLTSIADYVSRMKEGQKNIYFLIASSPDAAKHAPFVEALTSKGYEVLYLTESVDELVVLKIQEFEGKTFTDVTREDLEIDESEEGKKESADVEAELKDLTSYVKKVLGDKVEKVVPSKRLTDSPAIVVLSKFGWSTNMERIARAQAMGDAQQAEYMRGRRILEINPNHPIIQSLKEKVSLDSREVKEQIQLLYDAASLSGGYDIDSPKDFADRIYSMLAGKAGTAQKVEAEVV
ncbi:Heat shock protein 83-1 [Auxenochlorella protothecoides]|uniref:Heat shock protein 83-1 n=2 Tax=Auxenochlorella protothecoides TaxID=3075 RepID=A0A087SE64_AUXPR|nr:Heat shock protein 83-1 [Auxenochlorella protothecoides]KFM24018.1 Heat shock protein 83-1 [Auxenochlorella protothecoides]